MLLDRLKQIDFTIFLIGLPVILFWLSLPELKAGAIVISVLIFSMAELFRHFLVAERNEAVQKVKSIFLFGTVQQNEVAKFFHRPIGVEKSQFKYNAIYSSIFFFFVNFVTRISPVFHDIDSAMKYLFSLTICFWINCKRLESLEKVLFFHFAFGLVVFLNFANYSSVGFMLWLVISLLNFNFLRKLSKNICAKNNVLTYQRMFNLTYLKTYSIIAALTILTYFFFQSIVPGYITTPQNQKIPEKVEKFEIINQTSSLKIPKPILKELTRQSFDPIVKQAAQLKGPVDNLKLDLSAAQKDYRKLLDIRIMLDENKILSKAQLEKLTRAVEHIPDFDESSVDRIPTPGQNPQKLNKDLIQIQELSRNLKELSEQLERAQKKSLEPEDKATENMSQPPAEKKKVNSILVQKQNQMQKDQLSLQESLKNTVDSQMKLVERRQEKVIQKNFDEKAFQFKNYIIVISVAAIVIILFSLQIGYQRKVGPHHIPNLSWKTRSLIKELYLLIRAGTMPPAQEVIKSYYLIEIVFKEVNLGRQEEIPPLKYGQKIAIAFPVLARTVQWPIQLFCHVLYGEKTPGQDELTNLRKDLLSLLKTLKIV